MSFTEVGKAGGGVGLEEGTDLGRKLKSSSVKMSVRHLSGEVKWVIGYVGLEVYEEVEVGDTKPKLNN